MIAPTHSYQMKLYTPLVVFPGCNKVTKIKRTSRVDTYLPINISLYGLENFQFITKNIDYEWLLHNKSILSAIIDVESNGNEITEIGVIIYNRYGPVAIIHEFFKFTSETLEGRERFVHIPHEQPIQTFLERRAVYLELFKFCKHILCKGAELESSVFPEINFIDLNLIKNFPKIDSVDGNKLITAYYLMSPYLCPTITQSNFIVVEEEIRHNPTIECFVFWFILNNMNPDVIVKSFGTKYITL